MKVVIMAGGKGTRISSLFPDIPKPLIPINDFTYKGSEKPVLEFEIENLVKQGFTEIILTVSYMADKIQSYFGDGSKFGACITYFIEETPLGNAGALFILRQKGIIDDEPFLLLNADAVFDVDFRRMVQYHREHNALVTLFTHPNSHPYDSGLLITDENNAVTNWLTKEDERPEWYKNLVNAGLHVIDPIILNEAVKDGRLDPDKIGQQDQDGNTVRVDLDRQILKPLCGKGVMYSYCSPEYVKDMGTPERYYAVQRDYMDGVVTSRNLSKPQKAVFLDRDGTINRYVGFLREISDFELLPGVAESIRLINNSGFLCIVITNQPVIARGEVSVEQLNLIHAKMETLLGLDGAYINGLYYCPHHPDKGFEGEVVSLKINCECRKPKPGMLIKASEDFNIDLSSSWMIGDGRNDVLAGKNAGCKTVLLGSADESKDVDEYETKADFTAPDLLTAVKMILKIN